MVGAVTPNHHSVFRDSWHDDDNKNKRGKEQRRLTENRMLIGIFKTAKIARSLPDNKQVRS